MPPDSPGGRSEEPRERVVRSCQPLRTGRCTSASQIEGTETLSNEDTFDDEAIDNACGHSSSTVITLVFCEAL